MKQKKVNYCNLLTIILSLSLLNGCVAGTKGSSDSSNHNATTLSSKPSNFKINASFQDNEESLLNNKSKTIVNDPPTEGLVKSLLGIALGPVGGAFASWGIGEIYDQFNKDYTGETLNNLLDDMNAIMVAVDQIKTALKDIEYSEQIIIKKLDQSIQDQAKNFLDNIELGQDASWNQFVYATNKDDEDTLLSDRAALNALKLLINDQYLNKVALDAAVLSGNPESATKLLKLNNKAQFAKYSDSQGNAIDFITNLVDAEKVVLYNQIYMNQSSSIGFDDLNPAITAYNSSVTALIVRSIVSLQQLYLIEQTTLYLIDKDPADFQDLSLAEPGLLSGYSYQKNKKLLDQLFEDRANHLKSILYQNIFSDTPNFQSVYALLNNVKSEPGQEKFILFLNVPPEESNEYAQYEWKGVESMNPNPEYGGISESGMLRAKINNTNYQLNYLEDCGQWGNPPQQIPDKTVSFESSTNRLVCDNLDVGGTHYTGKGLIGTSSEFHDYNNGRGLKIYNTRDIMSSSKVQEGTINQDNNTVYWQPNDNSDHRHTVYGTVTFDYYLSTPSGKKDVFYDINFTQDLMSNETYPWGGKRYYHNYLWDTTASISCHANDPDCRQLAGKDDIESSSGYSRICIDHHNIVLQDTHGDSLPSVEIKDYSGSGC